MQVTSILGFEGWGFLCLLGAILAYRMLTGQINLGGLFSRKGSSNSNSVSPERIQLLLATLAMSANYVSSVVHTTSGRMPDVTPEWLYLMGGSSGIYVAGKALTMLRSKPTGLERTR
jgi:hypothetical protein